MDPYARFFNSATATTTPAGTQKDSSIPDVTERMKALSLSGSTATASAISTEFFAQQGALLAKNLTTLSRKDPSKVNLVKAIKSGNSQLCLQFSHEGKAYIAWKASKKEAVDLYVGIQAKDAFEFSQSEEIITISLASDRHVSLGGKPVTDALLSAWKPIVEALVAQTYLLTPEKGSAPPTTAMPITITAYICPESSPQKAPAATASSAASTSTAASSIAPQPLPVASAVPTAPQLGKTSIDATISTQFHDEAKACLERLKKAVDAIPSIKGKIFEKELVSALHRLISALDIFTKKGDRRALSESVPPHKAASTEKLDTVEQIFRDALEPDGNVKKIIARAHAVTKEASAERKRLKQAQQASLKYQKEKSKIGTDIAAACEATRTFLEKLLPTR